MTLNAHTTSCPLHQLPITTASALNVEIGEQHLRSKVPYPPQNMTVIVGAHRTWRHPEFVKATYNQKEARVVREIVFDQTKVQCRKSINRGSCTIMGKAPTSGPNFMLRDRGVNACLA